ncbi:Loki-CTERM sorting domain-containing protein, partial [Candidatus Hodarchaeum mangrovi]
EAYEKAVNASNTKPGGLTPGFELISILTSLGLLGIVFLIRKKKQH